MLMHADADWAYAALSATGDRHDPLRYLLLRIRELTPDEFAQRHIFEHTEGGARLVMPDVLPTAGYRRIVGQVGLMRIVVGTYNTPGAELPKIDYLNVCRRSVYVYAHPSLKTIGETSQAAVLAVAPHVYSRKGMSEDRRAVRRIESLPEPTCPLPQLNTNRDQTLAWANNNLAAPWWAKPHVPPAFQHGVRFGLQPPGAEAPEEIREEPLPGVLAPRDGAAASALPPAAPSVVVLPPRFLSAASPQVRAAAELACDRLAQEITAAGLARVVDRQQIDRLLRERALAGGPPAPMLSFDAMLRLEVDAPALVPMARVRLVDLSHGNPLSEAKYDWPLGEEHVPGLVEQCRDGLEQVGRPKDGKVKVRCFGVENPERNPRLAPLAARLAHVFDQAVARSPGLAHVRHFEAGSAKEEALLLLMGLSRLPGERQFVPQADATIELGLREGDGRGKTFEETPVEITVHVVRADAEQGQSLLIGGTAGEFDAAAARVWEQLADILREAQPAAAADWLDDMAVRRRQAEAELRAARAIHDEEPGTHDPQKLASRLAHAETALKMDPTFEEAAVEHLEALRNAYLRRLAKSSHSTGDLAERIFDHAVRYFEQFGPEAAASHAVHEVCRVPVHVALGGLDLSGTVPLAPQRLQVFQNVKVLLEHSVEHRCHSLGSEYQAMMLVIVARAMARTGVPLEARQHWIDEILQQCVEAEKRASTGDGYSLHNSLREHNAIWLRAARLAVEDGSMDRARRLIAELRERLETGPQTAQRDVFDGAGDLLRAMDDEAAVAEFDRWRKELAANAVDRLSLRRPALEVFRDKIIAGTSVVRAMPTVEGLRIRHAPRVPGSLGSPISVLVEGEGRLYLVMGGNTSICWGRFRGEASGGPSRWIGSLSLDDAGRPVGEPHHEARTGSELRNAVTLLPQPEVDAPLHVLAARYLAGRLYMGTLRNGLLVFDPTTGRWSRFGPEQGVPAEGVYAMHPLDGQTLFCVGRSEQRAVVCYTLSLPEGAVTLRHRIEEKLSRSLPSMFWHDGQSLRAWSTDRLYHDLLAPELTCIRQSCGTPYGWAYPGARLGSEGFIAFAEVDGRRFVTNAGLHEFDAKGKIVRSWWGETSFVCYDGSRFGIPLPSDCPIQSEYMVAAGELLVFIDRSSLLAWDPQTDTWYGPLAVDDAVHAVGTQRGVWLGTSDGLIFVAINGLLATARRTGRALTTEQYRQRQRQVVAALPPLDRALAAYSVRRFDEAKKLAEAVLADDPECAEALLLLGHLHDLWCMNRPEVAMEYYGRLAGLTANPNASFTGMYRRLVLLRTQKRWPEALAAIEQIEASFSLMHDWDHRELHWWRNHIQKQLAATGAKQPAGEASNREEGPGN